MRKILVATAVVVVSALSGTTPASASAGPSAARPMDTTGYCVSDVFYGNEPNFDSDGHVIPSQSPGPKKTLPDGSVVDGNSIGDYNSGRAVGARVNIPKLCHAATSA